MNGVFDYDLVVIGGGPAGSVAATFGVKHGLRVLLVEKMEFPRFRIGESLLPMCNALLREIGVWEKVETAGFVEKYGASFYLGEGEGEKIVNFADGYVSGLEMTYQVERSRFDALLLGHAREAGANIRIPAVVLRVESDGSGVDVWVRGAAGVDEKVRCAWLVDAGGRDQFYSSEAKGRLDAARWPKRVAVYSHFTGVLRAEGKVGGHTVIVRLKEGWCWLIPIDEQRTSVGIVLEVSEMRAKGGDPETVFRGLVTENPGLARFLGQAEAIMGFHVTADYSYFRRELAGERVVLCGDAAGFFDPIFSSGVYVAMESAKQAVLMILKAHLEGRALVAKERQNYTRRIKAHADVFRRLIDVFYDNAGFSVFMCPRPPLDLACGINSVVAGHARLIWPLWWRFQIFMLVCWLQRWIPLVQRVDWKPAERASAVSVKPAL